MPNSIDFSIDYNWPAGKNSFASLYLSPQTTNHKIRLLAENINEPGEYYTFNELVEGKHAPAYISSLLSEGASRGRYLTGDVFYLEIFDEQENPIKTMKFEAFRKKPAHASGPTSVVSQYSLEI